MNNTMEYKGYVGSVEHLTRLHVVGVDGRSSLLDIYAKVDLAFLLGIGRALCKAAAAIVDFGAAELHALACAGGSENRPPIHVPQSGDASDEEHPPIFLSTRSLPLIIGSVAKYGWWHIV